MSAPHSSAATVPPGPLGPVATIVHRLPTGPPGAELVRVEFQDSPDGLVGLWAIPDTLAHPLEPLVGFRAPHSWDAIGIRSGGHARILGEASPTSHDTRVTVIADRSGAVASVIERPDGSEHLLDEAPVGLVADVVARCLGLPTPPPSSSTAAFIEAVWIDRLATGVFARPRTRRSWRWLADRHPLRAGSGVPEPAELADRTRRHRDEYSWASLRQSQTVAELPAARYGPPGGTVLGLQDWFDDGSLSRWLPRELAPAELVLPDLLRVLPTSLGEALTESLVAVSPG